MSNAQPLRILVITSRPLVALVAGRVGGRLIVSPQPIALKPVGRVRHGLETALKQAGGAVAVRYLARATTAAVQTALLDPYDVVHFVGHGTETGELLLERDNASTDALPAKRAVQMLHGSRAGLVVISACHSGRVATALREAGLPNVIAVDEAYPLADDAAILFNQLFYGALARGRRLSEAFELGVDAVRADAEVGDHHPPFDEQTGEELPPWSERFQAMLADDRPLAAEVEGGYEVLDAAGARPGPTLPRGPDIIGREALLYKAIGLLAEARMLTLTGPGGIGKTTVGLELARWYAERALFPDGVFFVAVEHVADAPGLAQALAHALDLQLDPAHPWPGLAAALARQETLLLLDNADALPDDPAQDETSAAGALRGLLAAAPQLKLLVTSRQRLGLRGWEEELTVPVLTQAEAVRLFLRYAPTGQRTDLALAHLTEIRAICELLDNYPLALVVAAPQLGSAGMTPTRLWTALREKMNETLHDAGSRGLPPRLRSLRASLDLSYERLSGRARVVFFYLGLLPGGADRDALTALVGRRFEPAAQELLDRNLARWEADRYTQLAPIRAYAAATRPPARQATARARVVRYFTDFAIARDDLLKPVSRRRIARQLAEQEDGSSLPDLERDLTLWALRGFDAERANLLAAVEWAFAAGDWAAVRRLVDNLNTYLDLRSEWNDQVSINQLAVPAARQEDNRSAEGIALNNLGNVYQNQGRWDEASEAYQQSLTIYRELGDRHGEARTLNNLGGVYNNQGHWEKASEACKLSLTIYRELGDRHGEAQTLNNLGNVYDNQGRWDEAIEAYELSLTILRALGDRHGEGVTFGNLGNVYDNQGRWDEAIEAYELSLTILRALGDRHGESIALNNLGNVYRGQGRWAQASEAYEQSLIICRKLGDRHGKGQTLNNLGGVYNNQGHWEKASEACKLSLTIKRELGDRHGEGQTLGNMGNIYRVQGCWDEAIEAYQQSLDIFRELGDRHGESQTLNNLGLLYQGQDRWDEAIDHFVPALALALTIHPRPVMARLDRIVDLAQELAMAGDEAALTRLGQAMLAAVAESSQSDEALAEAAALSERVGTVLAGVGQLAGLPEAERAGRLVEILAQARAVDEATEGRWGLADWAGNQLAMSNE